MAGGTLTPLDVYGQYLGGGVDAGLPTHLDGARVFNASVALGVPVEEIDCGIFERDVLFVEGALRSGWVNAGGQPEIY